MQEQIQEFKDLWPNYLEQVYTDAQIEKFIKVTFSIAQAVDIAADNMMAQGLGEVQE